MAKSERRNVTFELPEGYLLALQQDAESRGSKSIHIRAKEIVVDYFANREVAELHDRIASLDSNVAGLDENIRRAVYSVIVHAAGKSSEEANRWIRENMPRTDRP
jgi:hypothetical protein